jgi:hypothetical protein
MNEPFSKTRLALMVVGLLAVIALKPRRNKDAPKNPPQCRPVPGPGGYVTP